MKCHGCGDEHSGKIGLGAFQESMPHCEDCRSLSENIEENKLILLENNRLLNKIFQWQRLGDDGKQEFNSHLETRRLCEEGEGAAERARERFAKNAQ